MGHGKEFRIFFYRQWKPLKDLSGGETLSRYVLQKGHPGSCECADGGRQDCMPSEKSAGVSSELSAND